MINIETLLSSFDERGTLLKWLKAVEKALNEATLTSVDVITISTQQIQLQFNFEDGTHLTTPTITLPKGDKGDTGEINVTSSVVIDTSMSASSENPVQNKVIYIALAGKQDVIDATHKLSADNVDDSATTNKFVTSAEKSTWNGKQNALTTSSVNDGTIDKTIGFDSQGNIVKGSAGGGGGGTQLYKHIVNNKYIFVGLSHNQYTSFVDIMNDIIISIVSYSSTPFTPFKHMYMFSTDGATFTLYNLNYDSNQMEYDTISSIASDVVTPL